MKKHLRIQLDFTIEADEEFQKGFSIVWGDAKFIEVEQDETGDHHE